MASPDSAESAEDESGTPLAPAPSENSESAFWTPGADPIKLYQKINPLD